MFASITSDGMAAGWVNIYSNPLTNTHCLLILKRSRPTQDPSRNWWWCVYGEHHPLYSNACLVRATVMAGWDVQCVGNVFYRISMPSENAPSLCRVARSRNHFCAKVEWKQDEGVYYGILAMGVRWFESCEEKSETGTFKTHILLKRGATHRE